MSQGLIFLLRHGETEWSKSGQHTGRTDIPLTANGEARAAQVQPMLQGVSFGLVLCSPLSRARRTAELAGLQPDDYVDDLLEWDYGVYEGRTTADIRAEKSAPDWVIWNDPIPGGETPEDVAARCRRVLARCEPLTTAGKTVALVAHGHLLRILTATYLGLEAVDGKMFALDAGGIGVLGHERVQPVIAGWNITPDGLADLVK
ncbi:MAG: histidine phosphatase family protein [Candidatus Nanopelagicales bacterium]